MKNCIKIITIWVNLERYYISESIFRFTKLKTSFFSLFSSARLASYCIVAPGAHRYLNFLDDAKVAGYQIDLRVDCLHCLLGLTLW